MQINLSTSASINIQKLNDDETITVQIPTDTGSKKFRTITLLQLPEFLENEEQSKKRKNNNYSQEEKNYSKGIVSFKRSGAKDLGMNATPVLDQGEHGTCATFVTSALLDTTINRGDYIDQQCLLALGHSLGYSKIWNFAVVKDIFSLFKSYGLVPKNNCYGHKYPNTSQYITEEEYLKVSDQKTLGETNLLSIEFSSIDSITKQIDLGKRVILNFAFSADHNTVDPIFINGFDISIDGSKKKNGGLWACAQKSFKQKLCSRHLSGHYGLIIGYDDKQRLLKIRNSWGENYADNGDFYMTYEFALAMGLNLSILNE